jgi:hypothetical protein
MRYIPFFEIVQARSKGNLKPMRRWSTVATPLVQKIHKNFFALFRLLRSLFNFSLYLYDPGVRGPRPSPF